MPTMTTTDTPVRVHSHFVKFTYGDDIDKEEVYLTFAATWRGEDALVVMSCDRYRHSSGLSDWRVYANEARGHEDEAGRYGPHLSDTARRRLSDGHHDAAVRWLSSDEYAASFTAAINHAIRREVQGMRPHVTTTANARRLVERWAETIGPDAVTRYTDALDAFDTFARLLDGES